MPKKPLSTQIYSLKITLTGLNPPIWRRVYVSSDTTLSVLHDIIQITMGWNDSHLHEFEINRQCFTSPEMMDEEYAFDRLDETNVKLDQIAQPKSKFSYLYDFGDNWIHEILVEKTVPLDDEKNIPYCVTGKRAAPPEDCGGIWGYADMLERLAGPNNAERKELIRWLGKKFNHENFDPQEVNKQLNKL
jgi:hypothetical protein